MIIDLMSLYRLHQCPKELVTSDELLKMLKDHQVSCGRAKNATLLKIANVTAE